MNRTALVTAVATATGLPSSETERTLSALLETIAEAVAAGESVSLPGFGTFEQRQRAARTGRNPRTGEPIEIAAAATPAFKPAPALRRRVAGD